MYRWLHGGYMANHKDRGLAGANLLTLVLVGAGEKSRTPDLRITNALLYQLSYTGVQLSILAQPCSVKAQPLTSA